MGITSRRQAEILIRQKRIKINDKVVTRLGEMFDGEKDHLFIDGQLVNPQNAPARVYWLFNKPDKTLVSLKSQDDKATIFELPRLKKIRFHIFPAGRLDYRTEGLLLLSNDGDLINQLIHPTAQIPRTYHVLVNKRLTKEQEHSLRHGKVRLEDGPSTAIKLKFLHGQNMGASKGFWYILTCYEGRNRYVRRLFGHFDIKVVRLIRVSFGFLSLSPDIKPGEYRQLSSQEIKQLKKMVVTMPQSKPS